MRLLTAISLLVFSLNIQAQDEIVFSYTGEVETYVVPACVEQISVVLSGASGGGENGGAGATVSGVIDVVEGQVIEIRVGGMGNCPEGGYNGGGNGAEAGPTNFSGCGGGGATDLRIAPFTLDDRIVVAAGGGGMGGGNTDAEGGIGDCANGGGGNSPFGVGGYGATQTAGGEGGPPWIGSGNTGGFGELAIGGDGASDPCYDVGPGGGGGGGYYGGGGGGSDCWESGNLGGGGGGGGSSFIPDGFTCNGGNVNDNGSVTIIPLGEMTVVATPNTANICLGDSVFVTLSGAAEYEWNASNVNEVSDSTFYVNAESSSTISIVGSNGICSDTIDFNVNLDEAYSILNSVNLCAGEEYVLPDGNTTNSPGSYVVELQTIYSGCDSTITTELTYSDTNLVEINHQICDGESVTLADGSIVNESGIFSVEFTSVNGCDSTIAEEVIISPSFDLSYDFEVCDDGSYTLPDGTVPSQSGVYDFSYETVLGCDSLVSIILQVNPQHSLDIVDEICQGEVYELPDGSVVSSAGEHVAYFQTESGCDSVITVHLSVNALPELDLGLEDSYCPYEGDVEVFPTPMGGSLVGDLLNGDVLEHEDASPGVYSASYSYTDLNGCSNSITQEYIIPQEAQPAFDYNIICHDLYFESLSGDFESCEWYLGEDLVAVLPEFLITFYEFGDYDLELKVFDEFGCEYSVREEVSLSEDIDLTGFFVPNVITPNQDFYNDYLELPDNFTSCLDYVMHIYNKWGIQVYEMTESTPAFAGKTHDGEELPEGVYFYTLEVVNYPCQETPELQEWCSGSITVFHD